MDDEFSLVATRARRANAGSRLKQLIQLEEQSADIQASFTHMTEDDENVNLLFQEDGEDEEFIEEDYDNLRGVDESDEEEENGEENENGPEEGEEIEESEAAGVNSDDVLSDSDISASDSDESEGEKELQKQERLKRKRSKTVIPTIIKRPDKPVAKKPKQTLISSDTLLLSARRSSSRSSAVENKHALVQKLKESEERRARSSPVPRIEYVELTQEEKLAEAVETERKNIIALNEFREQEIVKKEHQKRLLQLRRKKLTNVIRLISQETYVSPLDEINRAKRRYDLDRKRRKLVKKKKLVDETVYTQVPGEVDTELPYYKEEMARKREEAATEEKQKIEEEEEKNKVEKDEETKQEETKQEETKPSDTLIDDDQNRTSTENTEKEAELESREKIEKEEAKDNGSVPMEVDSLNTDQTNSVVEQDSSDSKGDGADPINETEIPSGQITEENNETETNNQAEMDINSTESVLIEESTEVNLANTENQTNEEDKQTVSHGVEETHVNTDEQPEQSEQPEPVKNSPESNNIEASSAIKSEDDDTIKVEDDTNKLDEEVKPKMEDGTDKSTELADSTESGTKKEEEAGIDDIQKKKVKFLDEVESSAIPESREDTPLIEEEDVDREVFEGPEQKVARQLVYLIDFEEDDKNFKLTEANIKSFLFGPQSLLAASRRYKDLKTISRIGVVDNPYSTVKQEEDRLFQSVSKLTEDNELFDELRRLPRLGVKQEIIEEVEEDIEQETAAIVIKTEAPTGLYLPNNNKKNCLISGTEVKYFDPSNGIPYSSVETYRFLKTIEQGNLPWYSLTSELNDTGVVEIYLGNREGSRHAKGVPEGFEG